MEDLNNKLAGLRATVKKIKKEIKSFEENETKNVKKRTNTLTNNIFRPSSYSKKVSFNKLNKKLMKNYFKLSLKEKNFHQNKRNTIGNDNNNKFKEIMTPAPQKINKKTNIPQIRDITKNSKSFKNNKNNINNGGNLNKYLAITDINNINNKSNIKNILFKNMTTRNKDYLKEKKDINNNKINQIDNIIMAYSNNDLKKNNFNNYSFKYKENEQNDKFNFLYNTYNNHNTNNNEYIYKNKNNSAQFNIKKFNRNRIKNISISNLLNINKLDDQSYSNENTDNNNLFLFNNSLIIKKKQKKNINKNYSYNFKTNFTHNNTNDNNKNQKLKYTKNDYHCGNHRTQLINNDEGYIYGNNLFNFKNYFRKDYNSNQEVLSYNKKQKLFPMNNTINCIPNNKDIDIYVENNEQKHFNKNTIKEIIGDNSIGDLNLKAKLFEKCGENNFNNFCNNFCETNNIIDNLNKYKEYLIKIKEEDNQYKRQINIYQKLCKRILLLMNPNQINDIIGEIEENFIENPEDDKYIIEQIKSILPN